MHTLDYEFTDKQISPWGGLRIIQEFFERSGLKEIIGRLSLPEPGSNRGYKSQDLIEGFMVSVILGARRFSHSGTLRYDEIISEIFNWEKGMASQSTFTRFFRKFSKQQLDEIFLRINQEWFKALFVDAHTIDLDSTVITRYGEQQGAEAGYNPKRHGRKSHHPLIAFSAEAKSVIHSCLRPGNSACSTDMIHFFNQVIAILGLDRIGVVRADSGFYGQEILEYFENHPLQYIISAKMNRGLVQCIYEQRLWFKAQDGIEYCTFMHRGTGWDTPRRFVIVRKDADKLPKSGGKSLFPEYDEFRRFRYSAFVTNMAMSGDLVWHIYKHRAEAENQIKELKYDYGIEGFCTESFDATDAAFRLVMVTYNFMSLFKQLMLIGKSLPVLSTLRFQCIAIGSYLVRSGRKTVLKLSAIGKKRDFLEGLFHRLDDFNPHEAYYFIV